MNIANTVAVSDASGNVVTPASSGQQTTSVTAIAESSTLSGGEIAGKAFDVSDSCFLFPFAGIAIGGVVAVGIVVAAVVGVKVSASRHSAAMEDMRGKINPSAQQI